MGRKVFILVRVICQFDSSKEVSDSGCLPDVYSKISHLDTSPSTGNHSGGMCFK